VEKFHIDLSSIFITEDDLKIALSWLALSKKFQPGQEESFQILEYYLHDKPGSGGMRKRNLPHNLLLARQDISFCLKNNQMRNFFTAIQKAGKLASLIIFLGLV